MTLEEWVEVTGTIMTTHRIEAYGGRRFPREELGSAAALINSRGLPMHVQHDLSRPLRVRNQQARVEDREEEGEQIAYLVVTYEIHPDDYAEVAHLTSFSVSHFESVPGLEASDTSSPNVVAGNAAWFDDEALVEAAALFNRTGVDIQVRRSLQYSFVPDPQILISLTHASFTVLWSAGVIGNAMWDGIKRLIQSRRTPSGANGDAQTVINLRVEEGARVVTHRVETSDPDVAHAALDKVGPTVEAFFAANGAASEEAAIETVVYDKDGERWVAPR